MSLGRIISPDDVGGNFGNVTADNLYDHGIDPAAALLNVITQDIHALGGIAPIISSETPPVLSDKSLSFDGTQELNLGDNFDLGAGDFAVAFFYRKVDALVSDDATLMSKGTIASNEWHIHLNLGPQKRVEWLVNAQSIELQSPNGSADDELWHHLAIVRLGSTITMYFDGVNVDSDTDSTDLTNSKDLILGFRGGAPFFGGFMTGIRIYSDDLTAAQVSNLNSGGDEATSEISFFRMAAADILSAPASNHGTLNGGAFFDGTTLAGQLQGKTGADEILAVFHDGVDDTVTFPAVTFIGEFTAALWFKPDDLTLQTLIGDVVTDRVQIGSSTTILVVVGAGTLTFTVPVMDTEWHDVVVARDASDNIRVFLDDVESSTGALVDAADATFAKIGAHGAAATDPFDGHTAKVVLEEREWSATERTAYFDDGSTTSAFTDFRSNTGLIKDAEPGAPAGTVSTQFDGVNDHIQTPTVPVVSYPLSLTSWVRIRPTVSGASSAIWLGDTSVVDVEIGIDVRGTDGFARAFSRNTGTFLAAIGAVDLRDDTWHFLCGLFDNEFSRKIYVDSVEIDEQTGQTPFPNINAIAIGRASTLTPGRFTEGQLRDPRIYNRTLTQTDIDNLFAHAAVPDGLLGNFPLASESNLVADNIGDFADTAQDSIGTNHGTLINYDPDPNLGWVKAVPAQLVGQQKFSLSFVAASSQHVDVSTGAPTFAANSAFSLSGWVKLDSLGSRVCLIGDRASTSDGFLVDTDNVLELQINGNALDATTPLVADRWYHVAETREVGGAVKIYLDGVDDTSGTPNNTSDFSTGNFGSRNSTTAAVNLLDGQLADFRTYGVLLTPSEVATLSGGGSITPTATTQQTFDDARVYETSQAWLTDAYTNGTRFSGGDVAQGVPFADSDFDERLASPTPTTGLAAASLIPPVSERGIVAGVRTVGAGVRFRASGDGARFVLIQSGIRFELAFIEFDANGFAITSIEMIRVESPLNFHHLLIHGLAQTSGNGSGLTNITAPALGSIHNNFVWDIKTPGGGLARGIDANANDTLVFANTIFDVNTTGGTAQGMNVRAAATAKNNVVVGCLIDFNGTGTGSSNNLSSDATAPGPSSVIDEPAVNVIKDTTLGSENLHLKEESPAIGAGANLMSTGIIGIHEDIDFAARPASGVWDVGADRATAVGDDFKSLATQGAWGFSISLSIGMGG